jgi:hypothetical protein
VTSESFLWYFHIAFFPVVFNGNSGFFLKHQVRSLATESIRFQSRDFLFVFVDLLLHGRSNAGMSPSSASSDNDVHCGDCIPGDDSLYIPGNDSIYIPGDDLFCPHGNDSFNFHQSEGHSFDSSPDSSLSETLPLSSYGATMNSVYVPCEQPRSSLVDYSSGHAEGMHSLCIERRSQGIQSLCVSSAEEHCRC